MVNVKSDSIFTLSLFFLALPTLGVSCVQHVPRWSVCINITFTSTTTLRTSSAACFYSGSIPDIVTLIWVWDCDKCCAQYPYLFFLSLSPSLAMNKSSLFFLLVTSHWSNSLHPLVSPWIPLIHPYCSFSLFPDVIFSFLYLLFISHLCSSSYPFFSPLPNCSPHSQSSCLPSIHTVICTVTDAAPAPSLSTVSPLCLQNSII